VIGDLAAGIVRVPPSSKLLFPAERAMMTVALRGAFLQDVRWDPRLGPDRERSGVLGIGKQAASQLIEGERLVIERVDGGCAWTDPCGWGIDAQRRVRLTTSAARRRASRPIGSISASTRRSGLGGAGAASLRPAECLVCVGYRLRYVRAA
jgi:hypothetical protein